MADDAADVDGFIAFSLSVQNRRKSRAGYSLENHLQALLTARKIKFQRGVETENKNKPDFLFPGRPSTRNQHFDVAKLTMLGSKSTCKDRWRQVLSEASRISHKHLLTLEPGISENQTDEMKAKQLQLVVPSAIHTTYKTSQKSWLMNVSQFVNTRGRVPPDLMPEYIGVMPSQRLRARRHFDRLRSSQRLACERFEKIVAALAESSSRHDDFPVCLYAPEPAIKRPMV